VIHCHFEVVDRLVYVLLLQVAETAIGVGTEFVGFDFDGGVGACDGLGRE